MSLPAGQEQAKGNFAHSPSWLQAPPALLWMENSPNSWDKNEHSQAQMLHVGGSASCLEPGHRGTQQGTSLAFAERGGNVVFLHGQDRL